ncbi:MAG: hypothetical protein M5R42_11140 [Rhodocyclaceae bacterium]|nr:hypothetical protein [Rhodocyclaceae bacterium]
MGQGLDAFQIGGGDDAYRAWLPGDGLFAAGNHIYARQHDFGRECVRRVAQGQHDGRGNFGRAESTAMEEIGVFLMHQALLESAVGFLWLADARGAGWLWDGKMFIGSCSDR